MKLLQDTPAVRGAELLDREEVLQKAKKYWALRRAQDVILSVGALLVLWPVMLVTALVIVIDSPGASPLLILHEIISTNPRCQLASWALHSARELEAEARAHSSQGD